jgi:hypothetical protein
VVIKKRGFQIDFEENFSMDVCQKRSSPTAAESRLTEPRHDVRELSDLCKNLEKRPDTGPVTRLMEVMRPVTLARSLAGTRDGEERHAEMASASFDFWTAERRKTP